MTQSFDVEVENKDGVYRLITSDGVIVVQLSGELEGTPLESCQLKEDLKLLRLWWSNHSEKMSGGKPWPIHLHYWLSGRNREAEISCPWRFSLEHIVLWPLGQLLLYVYKLSKKHDMPLNW